MLRAAVRASRRPIDLAACLVSVVADASLAAQERFDQRVAARRAATAMGRPQPRTYPAQVARICVALSITALLGVQVLGVGRSGSPQDAAPTASSSASSEAGPTIPVTPSDDATSGLRPADGVAERATADEGRVAIALDTPPSASTIPQDPRPAPPMSLRIPAIDVDAAVVPVGLEPDGAMEIPADVRTVGWYDPFEGSGSGLAPGEPGTAVIAGHVDSRSQGRGAFWFLRDLKVDDLVEVVHEDGEVSRWRIESVVRYPKDDIPIDEIFAFDGPPRIALITCGGEFDRSIGAYLENYVVTAVPITRTTLALRPPRISPS